MSRRLENFPSLFLIGSLFLHALIALWLLLTMPPIQLVSQDESIKRSDTLQVQPMSEADLKKRLSRALDKNKIQVVQTDERLKSLKAPDTATRLSKVDQAVDRETRAARVAKFKNILNEGAQNVKSAAEKLLKLADSAEQAVETAGQAPSQTGRLLNGKGRAPASLPPLHDAKEGEGFSATDDYLPDVAIGTQTLLNAREFKFYSFFEHIRRKLTDRWHDRLNREFQELRYKGRLDVAGERVTQVKVQLDARGQLKAVNVVGSSGVGELDRAAQEAFRAAAPFPNPPKEMMEGDSVTVRWDFVVVAEEGSGMKVRVRTYGEQ